MNVGAQLIATHSIVWGAENYFLVTQGGGDAGVHASRAHARDAMQGTRQ